VPKNKKARKSPDLVPETTLIRREIKLFLSSLGVDGKSIGSARGVYVFYDYFGEPIYVGQSEESLGARIGRHLTNQRTDAVAMRVLDPQEVAEIEVWPFDFSGKTDAEVRQTLAKAEYTVFKMVYNASKLKAVLNEKDIPVTAECALPPSYRGRIVPEPTHTHRKHPDIRIARRAAQAAELAKIVTERKVSKGLRRTLYQQARRLESLSKQRLDEVAGEIPVEGEDHKSTED
jgi:hypothetical protein